jgi:DNA polymerase III delta' subunit
MNLEEALACVGRALESGRLAQAYVVQAPPRTAGAAFAEDLAAMLFCEAGEKPCERCRGCRQARNRTHPDLFWLEPQKRSRIIAVDQVRDLCRRVSQTSFVGGWRLGVLVGAERMKEQAANAFLKTLEEPGPRTLFLLLTDSPQFLLPTVRSRCQSLTISGAQDDLGGDWHERLLQILAGARPGGGGGGVVAALEMSEQIGLLFREMKDTATAAEKELASEEVVEEEDSTIDARAEARFRELRTGAMRTMLNWYRDLLILACDKEADVLYFHPYRRVLCAQAEGVTREQAVRRVRTVETMNRRMERNLPASSVLLDGVCELLESRGDAAHVSKGRSPD